jgi:hypothetical protein
MRPSAAQYRCDGQVLLGVRIGFDGSREGKRNICEFS